MKQFYIFDNLEIIMGPYDTAQQAYDDLDLHQSELYLDLYYPNPYIDTIDGDEFEGYGTAYGPETDVKRERLIKRRVRE